MGIPVSFSELRWGKKWAVLNGRELDGTGSGWSRILRMGNFTNFPGKTWYPKNKIENADPYLKTQGAGAVKRVTGQW